MNLCRRTLTACAAFALASTAAQAIDVLYIANGDDATYQALIESKYPESNWVRKSVGTVAGSDTIGGDLDLTNRVFTGLHAEAGMSQKAYIQSFDLVIVDNPTSSASFIDGALGADWASINKPILFNSAFAARGLDGRVGLFAGGGTGTPILTTPAESVRLAFTPLSDAIFEDVADVADLYASTSTDSINAAQGFGTGKQISSISGTDAAIPTVTSYHGIAFWDAGDQIAVNHTLAAKRAFMPLKGIVGDDFAPGDLTADGRIALGNLIDELLVESEVVFLPPSGLTAQSAAGLQINLSWTATDGAVSYNVKRSTTTGGPYTTVSTPGAVTGTSYADTGLTAGITYFYVVSAVNAAATESVDSAQASAEAVETVLDGVDILYVASANNTTYQNLLTNGKYANNTWTHKVQGLNGNNIVGGDLSRQAVFTGINGTPDPGSPESVTDYLNRFELVIIGVPTGSASFVDQTDGAQWAELTVPLLVHSPFAARSLDGRLGLFYGDNTVNPFAFGADPAESIRVSTSALSDAILAGVGNVNDLYGSVAVDTINGVVRNPNAFGNGEEITRLTNGVVQNRGVVFWPAGSTLPVAPPSGLVLGSNRAFLPLSGGPVELNADGQRVLLNLIEQLQLPQTAPEGTIFTYPNALAAFESEGIVSLFWEQAINAASYNVKRSSTPGGPYNDLIGVEIQEQFFTDTNVIAGATYYYVVSAVSIDDVESANSDPATITLPGGDNFDAWILGFIEQLPNEDDRLPGADPDKDGKTNLVEFAINGNPADSSDNGAIASLIQNSSLTLIVAVRDGANFAGGPTADAGGINYMVEGSLGLSFPDSAVSSTGPTETAPAAAGLPDLTGTAWVYHTFTLDASVGLTGRGFLRLKVTELEVP